MRPPFYANGKMKNHNVMKCYDFIKPGKKMLPNLNISQLMEGYLHRKRNSIGSRNSKLASGNIKYILLFTILIILMFFISNSGTGAEKTSSSIIISELMTSNKTTIADEDGKYWDWIEISNMGTDAIELQGWGLSDDLSEPFKWTFPQLTIDPGQYIIIFASGKGLNSPSNTFLHTNFRLSASGEMVVLSNKEGQPVCQIKTPELNTDTSYGIDMSNNENWLFFPLPTPGRSNDTQGFQSPVDKSVAENSNVYISEYMALNKSAVIDEDGDFSDWIEITNPTGSTLNLNGYGLSDDNDKPFKWIFPDVSIEPGQYLLIFASGKDRTNADGKFLHTNFSLSPSDDSLQICSPSGRVLSSIKIIDAGPDISCGSIKENIHDLFMFKNPSPGMPNDVSSAYKLAPEPELSILGGFFDGSFYLSMSSDDSSIIRYTLDGSEPTLDSAVYSSPILIEKTTVVRARAFKENMDPSKIVTNTYFINKKHTLPVVSLSTNPDNLWDIDTGIYAAGRNASPEFPHVGANYWMDWEKPVHFELYEPDGFKGLGFDGGIKIFGSFSRAMDQKSFSIYTRDEYGSDRINYGFFEDKPDILSFKSILLRTSGQDAIYTKIRDAMMHRLVKDTEVDMQAYMPAVLYINGEYWGIYNIREKISRFYLASNHGVDPDNVDILEANGRVKYGSNSDYKELVSYVKSHDMRLTENYEYVKTLMDIENFIDYQIAEIYFANTDTGNIKFWRDRAPGGKWRWILYDTDWGFFDANHNTLWYVTNPEGTGTGKMFSTALMYNLLKNDSFKDEFIRRFAYHLNNTFSSDRVISIIDEMAKKIEPEIPDQVARWGGSVQRWHNEVQKLRDFAKQRPSILLKFIIQQFNLSDEEISLFKL